MKNPTLVASFDSEDPAVIVARKLRDAGFNARVKIDGRIQSAVDDLLVPLRTFRVLVPAVQAARAMSWCREFDAAEALLSHALRCPECGSLRVSPRNGESPVSDGFRCEACHSTWTPSRLHELADHGHAAA
jgi:hypothetical protein